MGYDKTDPKFNWALLSEHRKIFWKDDIILTDILSKVEGNQFVEFGANVGGFASIIAKEAQKRKGTCNSIDLFSSTPEDLDFREAHKKFNIREIFEQNMKEEEVLDSINIIQGCSWDTVMQFEMESIDFIWVDGNHHYKAVSKDLISWWPRLKKGGIIGGHDYADVGVQRALAEFFEDYTVHCSKSMCWSKRKE